MLLSSAYLTVSLCLSHMINANSFLAEKALASLPSPLIVSEEMILSPLHERHFVKVTAGLHRQTWVNGGNIFVDVHILNNSPKVFKKLDVHLDKTTLFYSHAAAGTIEKSIQHLRLPSRSETETVAKMSLKKEKFWKGIQPMTSEVRTCEIEAPRGHVTISTGRYFEVRYFLNVQINLSLL